MNNEQIEKELQAIKELTPGVIIRAIIGIVLILIVYVISKYV